jgi:hypothetical protein
MQADIDPVAPVIKIVCSAKKSATELFFSASSCFAENFVSEIFCSIAHD